MTIGTPESERSTRHTSMPFIPGSMRSNKTRSGRSSRTAVSAWVPSLTTAVSKPSPRNTMVSISANDASSSTTRILCLIDPIVSLDRDKTGVPKGRVAN